MGEWTLYKYKYVSRRVEVSRTQIDTKPPRVIINQLTERVFFLGKLIIGPGMVLFCFIYNCKSCGGFRLFLLLLYEI